jgi:hypothetical protein
MAGDGSTIGGMGEEADGSTAGERLYLRPALERVARFSARLRKRFGNSNRVSTGKNPNPGLRPWRTQMLICSVGRFRLSAFRKKVR